MKTLSLRGLWGYLIAAGVKDVENRTTLKNIRGWHLIHVSKSYNKELDLKVPSRLLSSQEVPRVYEALSKNALMRDSIPEKIKTGSIIGVMYIKGCAQNYKSKWAEPNAHNLILDTSKAILFDKPIQGVKGKLSVWDYPLPEEYYKKYPQLLEV